MRKDAALRREKLIKAAATLFERDGYDIPLELVATAAGVGRGTLYRNFPDRAGLMIAVLAHKLDSMERFVAEHDDDGTLLAAFLERQGLVTSLHAPAVLQLRADVSQGEALQTLTERNRTLLRRIAERSHAAGTLRTDVDATRLHVVTRMLMVATVWQQGDTDDGLATMVDIVLRGLAPGCGSSKKG